MKMDDIDKHLCASGVVKLIELGRLRAKTDLQPLLNSAGTSKPGQALKVHELVKEIDAANMVLHWIEEYLETIEV